MAEFNPYSEWLGLSSELVDPNHYQLLGLVDFEADAGRIAIAADKAMSRVRGFRPGPNARAWSKLLDELLLAKGRLLDPERKSEYDAELRESGNTSPRDTPPPILPAALASAAPAGAPDPRFPPGMGPNTGRAATKDIQSLPEAEPTRAQAPQPTYNPAPAYAAPQQPAYAQQQPMAAVPNVPPTAWPSSMLHPVAHQPQAMATPVAAQPAQAPAVSAPMATPVVAQLVQPAYAAPQAMPAGYGGAPQQYGAQQPPYAQLAYGQQPIGQQPAYGQPQYGAPAYPQQAPGSPFAAAPQYSTTAYGAAAPMAQPEQSPFGAIGAFQLPPGAMPGLMPLDPLPASPVAHSSYALGDANSRAMPGSLPLDPMAPVQMPTTPTGTAIPKGKAVSSAAAQQPATQPMASGPTSADRRPTSSAPTLKPAPAQPAPQQLTPVQPVAPPPLAGSSDTSLTTARNEKSQSEQLLFYGTVAAVLVLISAIGFAIANSGRGSDEENPEVVAENNPVTPAPTPLPDKPKPNPNPNNPKPNVTPPANVPNPLSPNPLSPNVPNALSPPTVAQKPPEPATTTPPPMTNPNPMTTPMPTRPGPIDPFEDPPTTTPMPPMPMTPAKPPEPMVTLPVPMPTPPKPPEPAPEAKLNPAELMALSQAMNSAKEALRERNFSDTDMHLATAKKLAKSQEQLAKLKRLEMLTHYVKQSDRTIKTLMADENFDAGAELQLGKSTRVVVVERSPQSIVIRINGQNRSYSIATLPDGLAMALIDKRLNPDDAATKLYKAAYLAAAKVPTEDNQAKAKELWEQARAQDPEGVGDLPMLLTDTYDFKE